jgi:hypothetical protein
MYGGGRRTTGLRTARYRLGKDIAGQYGRHERWGRLVKRSDLAGEPGT